MANSSHNISFCLCQTYTTSVVLPTMYTIMSLTGLPGNVISLWVFIRKIVGKTSTHIYLINLGISNMLFCLTMPFQAMYYLFGTTWQHQNTMCQMAINGLTPVIHINICIGVMILSWVALSRFASLIQHSHADRPSRWLKILPGALLCRKRQAKLAYALSVVTWVVVGVGVISFVVIYSVREAGSITDDKRYEVCYSVAVEVGGEGSQVFSLVAVSLFFVFFLLVLIAYMAVIRHIWRSKRSMAISDSQRVYTRVFRNIVVIKVVLVVCLLPHHIYKAIFVHIVKNSFNLPQKHGCHPLSMHVEVKNILLCLATLRCSTDPIMYFLLDKTFRKHTLNLLRLHTSANDSQSSKSNGGQSQAMTGYN